MPRETIHVWRMRLTRGDLKALHEYAANAARDAALCKDDDERTWVRLEEALREAKRQPKERRT